MKLDIEAIVGENVENDSMTYKKFSINKTVCYSSANEKMYRRNSNLEKSTGTFMSTDNTVCVQLINGLNIYIVLGKSFLIDGNPNWCSYSGFSSGSLFYPVKKTCNVIACLPSQVSHKFVLVSCDEKTNIV